HVFRVGAVSNIVTGGSLLSTTAIQVQLLMHCKHFQELLASPFAFLACNFKKYSFNIYFIE
ncbi:MAG: hypothetical protein ABI763_17400, partial [Bacteroidota bacterium]